MVYQSQVNNNPHPPHILQLPTSLLVHIDRIMRQGNNSQRIQSLLVPHDHLEHSLSDLVVSCIDVAHSLHELAHPLEPRSGQLVVADLESSDLAAATSAVHVFDHFFTGKVALGNVEEIR